MKKIVFLAIISLSFLSGCNDAKKEVTPINNKINKELVEDNKMNLLNAAQRHYSENRFNEAQNSLSQVSDKNDDYYLLEGLLFMQSNHLKEAKAAFIKIPEARRNLMAESCIELAKFKNKLPVISLKEVVQEFFFDCLEEIFGDLEEVKVELNLSDKRILELGKIYETRLGNTEDEQLRAKIEADFIKEFALTKEQLNEMSARYLELLSEDN